MSRSTGGFGATVCHLGGAAALAVAGSSATTAPAGRHATRPIAPGPQDRGGMWRPAPTSPWENPARTSSKISTAPDGSSPTQDLSKLASSMAHLTIRQPPWRCTGTTKGIWVSDRCARVRRHGNGQPTCEIAGQAGTRARRLRTPVHLIPNRMIQACPNPSRRPTSVTTGQGPVLWAWLDLNQRPHPCQAYSRDALMLVRRGRPARGWRRCDRGCPLDTGLSV
jgi:hypothetical protein